MRWEQIDFKAGLVHVARLKNGLASTHPIRGPELRALRELRRDYPDSPYLFVTERGGPMTPATARKINCARRRARETPLPYPSAHAAALGRLQARQRGPRHAIDPAIPRAPEHHAHGALYGAQPGSVQGFLEGLEIFRRVVFTRSKISKSSLVRPIVRPNAARASPTRTRVSAKSSAVGLRSLLCGMVMKPERLTLKFVCPR